MSEDDLAFDRAALCCLEYGSFFREGVCGSNYYRVTYRLAYQRAGFGPSALDRYNDGGHRADSSTSVVYSSSVTSSLTEQFVMKEGPLGWSSMVVHNVRRGLVIHQNDFHVHICYLPKFLTLFRQSIDYGCFFLG